MKTLLIAGLLATSLEAQAYALKTDAAGQPVAWQTSPTFVIDADLAQALDEPLSEPAIRASLGSYAAALPQLGLTLQVGHTHGVGFNPSVGAMNQNEIIAIDHDWPYDPGAVAITILTVDPHTGDILDADIALNTSDHTFRVLPAYSTPGGSPDDLQNTLTHELGHALGLAHNNDDPWVVMFGQAQKGEVVKRDLKTDDLAGLAFLYPATHAGGTPPVQSAGCSALPAAPSSALILLAWIALARTRRVGA